MNLPSPPQATVRSTAFWRRVHNLLAHPLLELLPTDWGDWLHDTTAALAFIEVEEAGPESEAFTPGREQGAQGHDVVLHAESAEQGLGHRDP